MKAAGSKSRTSAAIRVSNPEASRRALRPPPLRASIRPPQKVSLPIPRGVMAPIRVTTTRRRVIGGASRAGDDPLPLLSGVLAHVGFDVFHRLAHRGNLLGILVRDLNAELLFQGHHELYHVERVGAEIIDKRGPGGDFISRYPELFHDDVFDAIKDGCHRASPPRASR